jgi:hypothetical protein
MTLYRLPNLASPWFATLRIAFRQVSPGVILFGKMLAFEKTKGPWKIGQVFRRDSLHASSPAMQPQLSYVRSSFTNHVNV